MKRYLSYLMITHYFLTPTQAKTPLMRTVQNNDTIKIDSADYWKRLELNEVVVLGKKTIIDHKPNGIVYYIKNDPYAKGLNGIEIMQRIPRISVTDEKIEVAGKNTVRYILDGRLIETSEESMLMKLKSLHSDDIEKVELLTVPPPKYPADDNIVYISIKMKRDESLGMSGNTTASLIFKESLNSYFGGGIRQATKLFDYSLDVNSNRNKGINDLYREYAFNSHRKISQRRNNFVDNCFNLNTLLKCRPTTMMETGIILNLNMDRLKSDINDVSEEKRTVYTSTSHSPAKPNNAVTFTVYYDWNLDTKGKILSLTYNYFNKTTNSYSFINTATDFLIKSMINSGNNRYRINSVKLDATLPFSIFDIEAGIAYTAIANNSSINIENYINRAWVKDNKQSNTFNYTEKTSAIYTTISKNLNSLWFAKLGLRYEHTDLKEHQATTNTRSSLVYNYIFPTLNINYSSVKGFVISTSYSAGISRPRFNDLNPFRYYTTTTDFVAGNAYLKASINHNIEINFSYKNLYTVLYASCLKDGIGHVTRFNTDNTQYTIPENYIDYNKFGLYASYLKDLTSWWNIKLGGEVFYAKSNSNLPESIPFNIKDWSGKLEGNSTMILNKKRSLLFNLGYIHLFPHDKDMAKYKTIVLLNANLRYQLFNGKLKINLYVNDPFLQNVTKTTKKYSTYTEYIQNNVHTRNVSVRVTYLFGGKKVREVYKDNKETESNRSF